MGRVIDLHPLFVTAHYIVIALLVYRFEPPWVIAPALLSLVVVNGVWAYAAGKISERTCREASFGRFRLEWATALFLAAGSLLILQVLGASSIFNRALPDPLLPAVFAVSYFGLMWSASARLVAAEEHIGQRSSVFGTFLLYLYFPFGVWNLQPRVARLRGFADA